MEERASTSHTSDFECFIAGFGNLAKQTCARLSEELAWQFDGFLDHEEAASDTAVPVLSYASFTPKNPNKTFVIVAISHPDGVENVTNILEGKKIPRENILSITGLDILEAYISRNSTLSQKGANQDQICAHNAKAILEMFSPVLVEEGQPDPHMQSLRSGSLLELIGIVELSVAASKEGRSVIVLQDSIGLEHKIIWYDYLATIRDDCCIIVSSTSPNRRALDYPSTELDIFVLDQIISIDLIVATELSNFSVNIKTLHIPHGICYGLIENEIDKLFPQLRDHFIFAPTEATMANIADADNHNPAHTSEIVCIPGGYFRHDVRVEQQALIPEKEKGRYVTFAPRLCFFTEGQETEFWSINHQAVLEELLKAYPDDIVVYRPHPLQRQHVDVPDRQYELKKFDAMIDFASQHDRVIIDEGRDSSAYYLLCSKVLVSDWSSVAVSTCLLTNCDIIEIDHSQVPSVHRKSQLPIIKENMIEISSTQEIGLAAASFSKNTRSGEQTAREKVSVFNEGCSAAYFKKTVEAILEGVFLVGWVVVDTSKPGFHKTNP